MFGPQRVQSLSSGVGLGSSAGAAAIAALLPVLIDKLTPDGRAPQNQWRRIFEANRDQISNPDLIHPGQKLKIPNPPRPV